MKYIKMLGLAAVAAAALMAFVGASTASATVLCKVQGTGTPTGTTCPAASAYGAGQEIHLVSEGGLGVVITTGSNFTEITCKSSTIKGVINNEGSASETVTAGFEPKELTWGECSTPTGACTVTTVKGGTLEIHWIDKTHNGTVTGTGFVITSNCASIFGNIHCEYVVASEDIGTLTGGNPATIEMESTPLNLLVTSGLCPEAPKLDAKYEITTSKPLYVTGHT